VSDLLDRGNKQSIQLSTSERVTYLLKTLGPRVTAAALGLSDARPLRRWSEGQAEPREDAVADRLRILYRVVYAITEAYGPAAASAFIRSANPQLDDDAVLFLLRDDEPLKQEKRIVAATRAFLEE
jgi:hypothetical protein